jgi:hypothetical protein
MRGFFASRALLDEPFWFCLKAKPKREHLPTWEIALQPRRKMPPKEITELKDAIRTTHGCESLHVESIPVKEAFEVKLHGTGPLKFSILSVIPKRNALTHGGTATVRLYSKSRHSIHRSQPLKWRLRAKHGHDQISIDKNDAT